MPHYNVYGSDSEWYVDICLYLLVFEICNQFVGVADFELLFWDSSVLWNFSNLGLVNQRSNPKSHLFIPFEFLLSQSGIGYWNSSTMRIGSSNTYIIFILYLLHLFFFCVREIPFCLVSFPVCATSLLELDQWEQSSPKKLINSETKPYYIFMFSSIMGKNQ